MFVHSDAFNDVHVTQKPDCGAVGKLNIYICIFVYSVGVPVVFQQHIDSVVHCISVTVTERMT